MAGGVGALGPFAKAHQVAPPLAAPPVGLGTVGVWQYGPSFPQAAHLTGQVSHALIEVATVGISGNYDGSAIFEVTGKYQGDAHGAYFEGSLLGASNPA